MKTSHLASLGARPIPRRDFIAALELLVDRGDMPGRWSQDAIDGVFRQRVLP
jgi:leucyl/phenylalanyl-tRNA--protein transferase